MLSLHHQQPGSYCLFSMTTVLSFQEYLMWYICMVSVQLSSVTQLCPTLQPHGLQPGFPVLHHLLEFAQTHVHWVGNAIQSSHPLLSPSPPVFNLSQHQGLFQWVGSLHQVAKVKEFQHQHQSFHEFSGLISFRIDWFPVQRTLKSLTHKINYPKRHLPCHHSAQIELPHPTMPTS